MNWSDVLPAVEAARQEAESRHARVLLAVEAGARMTEIAAHVGLTQARVWQMKEIAKYRRGRPMTVEGWMSNKEPLTKNKKERHRIVKAYGPCQKKP